MNDTERQETERELQALKDQLHAEIATPAVSVHAQIRRAEWAQRTRGEIDRLKAILSRDGASVGGETR